MICDSCILSYRDDEDMLVCDETECHGGSKYLSACGIPINWIEDQIKKNPGRHASSWQSLLDRWKNYIREKTKKQSAMPADEYVRMHKDPEAARKFWRNE